MKQISQTRKESFFGSLVSGFIFQHFLSKWLAKVKSLKNGIAVASIAKLESKDNIQCKQQNSAALWIFNNQDHWPYNVRLQNNVNNLREWPNKGCLFNHLLWSRKHLKKYFPKVLISWGFFYGPYEQYIIIIENVFDRKNSSWKEFSACRYSFLNSAYMGRTHISKHK